METINTIAEESKVRPFNQAGIELLNEYCNLLEPAAQLLDIFQSENKNFAGIGIVLPLIVKLKQKLNNSNPSEFRTLSQ